MGVLVAAMQAVRIQWCRHVLKQRYLLRKVYDYWMYLDATDRGISRTLLLFAQRELDHKQILEQVLRPGMMILDIGANLGYYVLMEWRRIGPGGRICAVEPSPYNQPLLKRNMALNGCSNVTVLPYAVSDQCTTQRFHIAAQSNLNTFHPIGTGITELTGEQVDVETLTVPELVRRCNEGAETPRQPDLIRMDVEGHEVEVLNGLLPAIEQGIMAPMVLFETHLSRYTPDHDLAVPLRRLFQLGYRVLMAASSSTEGTARVEALGYRGTLPIETDFTTRVIFGQLGTEDSEELICRTGGLRTVLLGRPGS
jgi:FkbM family methyltransferase